MQPGSRYSKIDSLGCWQVPCSHFRIPKIRSIVKGLIGLIKSYIGFRDSGLGFPKSRGTFWVPVVGIYNPF